MVGHPTAPTYTFPDPLEVNTTYYWAVRAHNTAGDCDLSSAWSESWTVSIVEEVVPLMSTAFLPMIIDVPYVPPAIPLLNGDFEQGATVWAQMSVQGWPIIVNSDEVEGLPTHSGIWSAWLGGDDDEISYICLLYTSRCV